MALSFVIYYARYLGMDKRDSRVSDGRPVSPLPDGWMCLSMPSPSQTHKSQHYEENTLTASAVPTSDGLISTRCPLRPKQAPASPEAMFPRSLAPRLAGRPYL